MSEVRIVAEPRTEFGKGAARRVRRANKVPAVLYGHGDSPRHFSLPGHELMLALKHDANALLALQTEAGEQLALPKVVVRDPIRGYLEHVDLVAVRRGEKVTVEIPVVLTGEAGPDVIVDQQTLALTVQAEATHLPEQLEVSIAGLAAGDSVTAGNVPLPEGTTIGMSAETVIVQALAAPTGEQVDAELAAAEQEMGAGQSGDGPVSESGEAGAADVDAGEGTGDVVPQAPGA